MSRRTLVKALLVGVLGTTLAPFGPAHAEQFKCTGPFDARTTHDKLVAAFGNANVVKETIYDAEGIESAGTVVFPKDPARKVIIRWDDDKTRRLPAKISLDGTNWTGPRGLRVGLTLAEVEALNGKPFTLYGFGWDYGGTVSSWNGGALDKTGGSCRFVAVFQSSPDSPDELDIDRTFSSANALMKRAGAVVASLWIEPQR